MLLHNYNIIRSTIAVNLLILLTDLVSVTGIRLKNVTIPSYAVKDGSVQLFCDFVLESDTLLVLKWYKDHQEFFRFNPSTLPSIMTFKMDGVSVDTMRSNLNIVTLRNITLDSGGMYKCEVSVERSFRTLSDQSYLHVIAPPLSEPVIAGVSPAAAVGERLAGNCTSYRSKPAASLMLYVNNEKMDPTDLIEFSPINEKNGLETSMLGFNFSVESKHFMKGKLELKCTATIGNSYWVRTHSIVESKMNVQPSFSSNNKNQRQDGFMSGDSLPAAQRRSQKESISQMLLFGFLLFTLLI